MNLATLIAETNGELGGYVAVQWHRGSGSGVRSWKLYGITKIHLALEGDNRTLCRRLIPRRSLRLSPDRRDEVCLQCERYV